MSNKTSKSRSIPISRERLDRIAARLAAHRAAMGKDQAGFKVDLSGWISALIDKELDHDPSERPGAQGPYGAPDVRGPKDELRPHDVPRPQAAPGVQEETADHQEGPDRNLLGRPGAQRPQSGRDVLGPQDVSGTQGAPERPDNVGKLLRELWALSREKYPAPDRSPIKFDEWVPKLRHLVETLRGERKFAGHWRPFPDPMRTLYADLWSSVPLKPANIAKPRRVPQTERIPKRDLSPPL